LNRELRNVGLADDDGAGSAVPRDRRFVFVGLEALIRCAAPGRGQAGRKDVDFDSERHAVERGQLRAPPPAQGRSLRCLARRRPIFSNNRVYRRIDLVDARMDRLKSLRGRESSIRITPRQSRCVEFAERGWRGGGSVLAVAMGASR
jgi:hypothetical protein